MSKYVFFTGGVVSGLGKGITAASLGALFKARGYSVAILRFNPFFNVDSSNLSPQLHGEIYITEDGRACDLVVGHYERILGDNLHAHNDVTSGEIYSKVITKERLTAYNGSTVQIVPHITDEIKSYVTDAAGDGADIVIVEVGGTVGDIETQPYLEAIRQLRSDLGKDNVAYVHVSLVNYIEVSGEQKTKPTQHSVKELQNLGIRPDVIVCRSDSPLEHSSRNKLSLFCNVDKDCIIENTLTDNIYEIPIKLEAEGFCKVVLRNLKLEDKEPNLSEFLSLNQRILAAKTEKNSIKIGIVSRFAEKLNAHISVRQALTLSAATSSVEVEFLNFCNPNIDFELAKTLDGLVITEGAYVNADTNYSNERKLIDYAKNSDLPILLIDKACLIAFGEDKKPPAAGISATAKVANKVTVKSIRAESRKNMHSTDLMVAEDEVCTKVLIKKADKCRFCCFSGKTNHKLLNFGARQTHFIKDSLLHGVYGDRALERHNLDMVIERSECEASGFKVSGICPTNLSVDAFELSGHKFFVGVLFHPEFSVKFNMPNKLITRLVEASKKHKEKKSGKK